ncbi:hypothetical protein AcW1_000651 [Taiwanofungus camphoratus]|nr:hypothetical protein AcW1_000651 [Antrodia cinnamomea]
MVDAEGEREQKGRGKRPWTEGSREGPREADASEDDRDREDLDAPRVTPRAWPSRRPPTSYPLKLPPSAPPRRPLSLLPKCLTLCPRPPCTTGRTPSGPPSPCSLCTHLQFYSPSLHLTSTAFSEEKGYGADEIDLKTVDLCAPSRSPPPATLIRATVLQPRAKTTSRPTSASTRTPPCPPSLSPSKTPSHPISRAATRPSRTPRHVCRSLCLLTPSHKRTPPPQSIVEFLDKSRSTQSRTHTTSSAPSPALSPATIAFSAASDKLIALLHSPAADPNALTILNARSNDALRTLAAARLPMLSARATALDALLADNAAAKIRVSDKTRVFWEAKRAAADGFLQVFRDAESPDGELGEDARRRRTEYFAAARKAWAGLADVLLQLNAEIIGPYVLGDQLSLADLHLAAWLARLAQLAGASAADDGARATALLEAHAGTGLALPRDFAVAEARRRAGLPLLEGVPDAVQSRLAAFWDAVRERASWKRVYADGLH